MGLIDQKGNDGEHYECPFCEGTGFQSAPNSLGGQAVIGTCNCQFCKGTGTACNIMLPSIKVKPKE